MCYCPNCNKQVDSTVRHVEETYPVLGEDTTILATVRFCNNCGESIWDEVLDNQNLLDAFNKYKLRHNISRHQDLRGDNYETRAENSKETYSSL